MREAIKRFGGVLLIGLLLIKISAFHVYEHHAALDGPDEHCETCLLAIGGQQYEGLFASFTAIDFTLPVAFSPNNIISSEQNLGYVVQKGLLFSRPPPSILS